MVSFFPGVIACPIRRVADTRVTTLMNELLRLPSLRVTGVRVEEEKGREAPILVIEIARRFRLLTCPDCGTRVRRRFKERWRRWRHLSVLGHTTYLERAIRRLRCRDCVAVVSEEVLWARPGSVFTRPFEDAVSLLAQKLSLTAVSDLMGVAWATVGSIAERLVDELLAEDRFEGLRRIGIDEISYRRQHRYLTIIVDHDRGRVIWAGEGKSSHTVGTFFDELGPEWSHQLELVSIDMSAAYEKAVRSAALQAEIVFDGFHLARLANDALTEVQRAEFHKLDSEASATLKGNRWILLKRAERLQPEEQQRRAALQKHNRTVYRAYLLKESFLDLFDTRTRKEAEEGVDAWLAWASRSQLPPFVRLAWTVRKNRQGILGALELSLSNARLEGTNNKIPLLSHRAFGFHSTRALIAMIYLCCACIDLPRLQLF